MATQAASFIYIKKATDTMDAKQVTSLMFLTGSVVIFIISLFIHPRGWVEALDTPAWVWGIFFGSGLITTGLGHLLYNSLFTGWDRGSRLFLSTDTLLLPDGILIFSSGDNPSPPNRQLLSDRRRGLPRFRGRRRKEKKKLSPDQTRLKARDDLFESSGIGKEETSLCNSGKFLVPDPEALSFPSDPNHAIICCLARFLFRLASRTHS